MITTVIQSSCEDNANRTVELNHSVWHAGEQKFSVGALRGPYTLS